MSSFSAINTAKTPQASALRPALTEVEFARATDKIWRKADDTRSAVVKSRRHWSMTPRGAASIARTIAFQGGGQGGGVDG